MDSPRKQRILAVASSGGHWVQLRRLAPAFAGHEVTYLTTDAGHRDEVAPARCRVVPDVNRSSRVVLALTTLRILWATLRVRPTVVISTGAAPGYIAMRCARLVRARTVWVDSIANADELSLSGRMASTKADLCLTQWAHLAAGPVTYSGSVL